MIARCLKGFHMFGSTSTSPNNREVGTAPEGNGLKLINLLPRQKRIDEGNDEENDKTRVFIFGCLKKIGANPEILVEVLHSSKETPKKNVLETHNHFYIPRV